MQVQSITTLVAPIRQTVDVGTPLPAVVDQLADVQAAIAVLENLEANLKAELIKSGLSEICGSQVRAVVSTSKASVTVSWKALAESFKPSPEIVAQYATEKDPVTSVRLYGFN